MKPHSIHGASLIYRKISIDFVLIANPDFYQSPLAAMV